jgi:hypothetical protein
MYMHIFIGIIVHAMKMCDLINENEKKIIVVASTVLSTALSAAQASPCPHRHPEPLDR